VLPDGTTRQFRDQRYVLLALHFEPPDTGKSPIPPAGPVAWTDHIPRALELPDAFARFLEGPLDLAPSGVLPIVLGFRLEAQRDMADLIDITGLRQLPAARHTGQAIGYFIGDRDGVSSANATTRMINDVLRYTLKVER
jgi:hypothetical protein